MTHVVLPKDSLCCILQYINSTQILGELTPGKLIEHEGRTEDLSRQRCAEEKATSKTQSR